MTWREVVFRDAVFGTGHVEDMRAAGVAFVETTRRASQAMRMLGCAADEAARALASAMPRRRNGTRLR